VRDETLIRPVLILASGRLVIATTAFITIAAGGAKVPQDLALPIKTVLFVAIVGSVLFITFSLLMKRLKAILISQFVFDFLLESFFIYLTGAVASPVAFLYLISTVFAAVWLSFAAGITYASASTVALALMCILYNQASEGLLVLPFLPEVVIMSMGREWLPRLVLNSGVAFMLAILSGQLMRAARHLSLFYAPILENIAEGVLAFDHHNRLIFINNGALKLLGIEGEPTSFTGRTLEELLSAPRHLPLKNLLLKGEMEIAELEIETDGKRKELEVHISTLMSKKRRLRGKVVLLMDLTLRREMEETKRRTERLMELEEVSVGLAHELRNPLASIRGCAQQLERIDASDSRFWNLTSIIKRESDRLDGIVSRFLNLARAEPLNPVRTDIKTLLEETVGLLKTREEADGVEFELKAPRLICHCDVGKMRQVFLNIGINALEALSGKGRLTIEAKETSDERGEYHRKGLKKGILIVFSDTGRGIRAKELPKIFMPFFTTKTDGVGMGLAIANKIVAEHGGIITVDSSLGKGTTFRIWLPRVPKPQQV